MQKDNGSISILTKATVDALGEAFYAFVKQTVGFYDRSAWRRKLDPYKPIAIFGVGFKQFLNR